jgi:hypothetical protein
VGEVRTAAAWLVSGTNGENVIDARAPAQAEAWRRALAQAEAVGMAGRRGGGCNRRVGLGQPGPQHDERLLEPPGVGRLGEHHLQRVGVLRVVPEGEVPAVLEAPRKGGYLK